MSEAVLRMRQCRYCGQLFGICTHCDRGQCYCGAACRSAARQHQRRAANRRYQRTDTGRRMHRMRQRGYRLRRGKGRVTDQGCHAATLPRSPNGSASCNCTVCGRHSQWIDPFPPLGRLRRLRGRRPLVKKLRF